MVRRRPNKGARTKTSRPREVAIKDAKIKKWETISDMTLDEEDQFHASKDRVLLESEEDIDEGDEDEVFGLKGLDQSDEESSGGEVPSEQEKADVLQPKTKRHPKKKFEKDAEESSDEGDSISEEEVWGRSKAAYMTSHADQLDSEDEDANELYEAEARRLQAKSRDGMVEADFGLGDLILTERVEEIIEVPVESAPQPRPIQQDNKSLIRHLEKNNPEALALARDWGDTAIDLIRLKEKVAGLTTEADPHIRGILHLHYQTLLTYATTLAFYLHLRASEKYAQHPELLSSHPIMDRLLTLKQSLSSWESIEPLLSDECDFSDDEDFIEDWELEDETDVPLKHDLSWNQLKRKGLEDGELGELIREASMPHAIPALTSSNGPREQPPKKRRKTSSSERAHPERSPVFDLTEPVFQSSKSTVPSSGDFEVFGDATALERTDASEKSSRKRSLRFHTSKIESTRKRRQDARNNAVGGDDDIPYRERRKEREMRAAKSQARGMVGDDLDDAEPGPRENAKQPTKGVADDLQDIGLADMYHDLAKEWRKEKKEQKKAEYEQAQAKERLERDAANSDNASGPRSLTHAMLANKGVTPRRPKASRNPRVKKREQFEKAKKRVSSQKAVYKGGIGDVNKYEGEKTGITKVVKSIKLA